MDEMTPIERAAMVADALARGEALTSRRVAEMTDCQQDTARRLLVKLCRVLPITEDSGQFVNVNTYNWGQQ